MRGLIVTALFTAFEIYANHVQMTYYYLFVIFFMVIAFLVQALKEKQLARFLKATGACAAGAALAVCINLSTLYHTWQYGQESMRGKSELVKKNNANQSNSGLERDYITQWSYGIGETWTLLVPNTKGGASVPMSANPIVQEKGNPELSYLYQQIGQYWGEQLVLRPSVRWRVCADALHSGSFHRERPNEVGFIGCNGALCCPIVG